MDERQCLFLDVCSNWGCHEQVMSDWAEATTMSMLGPVTCSALTVTDPLVPPDELVCWLMITLIPPGREMERFGLETRIDWPATVNPTSCALPLVLACPPLGGAGVRFHNTGGNQAIQQVYIQQCRLRLAAAATPGRGTFQRVSRGYTRDVHTRYRRAQAPAA